MGIICHLFPDKAMSDHIPIIFLVPGPFISRFCDGPQHPRLVSGRKKKLGVWTGLKNLYRFNIVTVQISFFKYVETTCPKYLPERPLRICKAHRHSLDVNLSASILRHCFSTSLGTPARAERFVAAGAQISVESGGLTGGIQLDIPIVGNSLLFDYH